MYSKLIVDELLYKLVCVCPFRCNKIFVAATCDVGDCFAAVVYIVT